MKTTEKIVARLVLKLDKLKKLFEKLGKKTILSSLKNLSNLCDKYEERLKKFNFFQKLLIVAKVIKFCQNTKICDICHYKKVLTLK